MQKFHPNKTLAQALALNSELFPSPKIKYVRNIEALHTQQLANSSMDSFR